VVLALLNRCSDSRYSGLRFAGMAFGGDETMSRRVIMRPRVWD